VLAPVDGVVHSFANNAAHLDYGPTILLAHETTDGTPFFTLYGHLALESLDGLVPGQEIRKGTPFAWIGSADVNGGWPPHLHFQVITHLFGASGEFPGGARPSERSLFTKRLTNLRDLWGIRCWPFGSSGSGST
jgi:murein DD-endopeptidase MepM/ murein hydrolase activator NlpD